MSKFRELLNCLTHCMFKLKIKSKCCNNTGCDCEVDETPCYTPPPSPARTPPPKSNLCPRTQK